MKLRGDVSEKAGRIIDWSMSLIGRRSTALPGYVAERIDPKVLYKILQKRRFSERIIVTGTNGKTTTTLLLKNVLQAAGYAVVNNDSGSNLSRGVLTTLLQDLRQGDRTVLLLEVDEASMPVVVDAVQPTHIVVMNLFRDQLDRYGEVTTTQQIIKHALDKAPDAKLILNADDPWVAMLGRDKSSHFFGLSVARNLTLPHDFAADIPVASSGAGFSYSRRYFGHLGHYAANDGSFRRPKPEVQVLNYVVENNHLQRLRLTLSNKQHSINTHLRGIYNAYNISAVMLTSMILKINLATAIKAIEHTAPAFGRQEKVAVQGVEYDFQLIKNPIGFNQVIQEFCMDPRDNRPIVFAINDNFADGRDVSWLWDVAIEDIQTGGPCITSGIRAYDMALRLQYAGIECEVIPDIRQALHRAATIASVPGVRILPTYTALLEIRKQFALKLEHAS
ncbi:DUF1727 domain-containing protein [bacterium]|nr:DUF1727 domain-containing protein [bacterium]